MKYTARILALSCMVSLLNACGDGSSNSSKDGDFSVPSDSNAQYFIIERGGTMNEPIIVTRRVGSSGESYSKRIYNCLENTVKYLGSGSTLVVMNNSKPAPKMALIVDNSIAYHVKLQACK